MNRRQFLGTSGGLVLTFSLSLPAACAGSGRRESASGALTAYLTLAGDGSVTFHSPTTELGQGTHTGQAVLIADELDFPLGRIRVQTAEPSAPFRRGDNMSTGGSTGMRMWHERLRKAAAQARQMLLSAAAAELDVDREELDTDAGEVVHRASGRRLTYASLAGAAGALKPPEDPPLRDPADYRYLGMKVPRVDVEAKVRGDGVFASDVERPGMAYACARLSPVFGAAVESIDEKPALAVPGVEQVVEIPGGAAVVAVNSWAAIRGAAALGIRFAETPHDDLDSVTISGQMRAGLDADEAAIEARHDDGVAAAFAKATRSFEGVYEAPYLCHSPLEAFNCTAELDADGVLHLWAPTQAQDRWRDAAAEAAGLPVERVRLHTAMPGGAFGRRLGTDGVPGAVRTAMAFKRPVKFFWRREDEIGQGWYRPAQVARLRAAIDVEGKITAMAIRTAGPSLASSFSSNGLPVGQYDGSSVELLRNNRYRAGALRVDWVRVDQPAPMAPWRSVGATQNGYFLECFLDELARELDKDPYRLRRELLEHDARALKVIDTAAEAAGWDEPLPEGRARGMAFVESFGSLCAEVAEVSLDAGRPVIHRVVCALDCGSVVLPDAVRAQVEGGINMGLSSALGEQVVIADGGASNNDLEGYKLMRIADAPLAIETVIIESGESMGGVGEPPLPPAAPALVNALFALTGRPIRRLPLSDMDWS